MASRRILLFGTARVEEDGHWIQIGRRKAVALLAYLVVTRQAFTREALASLFWTDAEPSRGLAYLRTTLWTLNQALGEDWAVIEQDAIAYNPAAGITDDVSEFRAKIALHEETHAAALYRGDFLSGFNLPDSPQFEEWQFFQREDLKREFTLILERLIAYHSARDEFETALGYARRWLMIDALHEPAHRWLMRLYIDSGQRSAAIRQYQELSRLLEAELGVEPEAATQELYREVMAWRVTGEAVAVTPPLPGPVRTALPQQTTPFVGRTQELSEVKRLLCDVDCRLLTICAPGGMGKTRLAIQAASQTDFADGIYFVPLAPVRSVDFLVPTIIETVRCSSEAKLDSWQQFLDYLSDKRLLLVLDNFEHLLEGADLLPELLAAAPGIKLLVTTRERLNLREEWVFDLRGLDYPLNGAHDSLETYSAVRLFIQGARRVRPNFEIFESDLEHVVKICNLVDGMPLGLELAAAWAQLLTVQEIANEIQKSLDFLSTSLRNVPERHRSLRALFEHSWGRLTPDEQTCLRELSIFHGAFTLEAAQAVAGASLYMLLALVNKSLLRRNHDGRFELHELLRQFAEGKMTPANRVSVADRHAAYYGRLLTDLSPKLKNQEQPAALEIVQQELDDIRGAWQHAAQQHQWSVIVAMFEPLIQFALARYRNRDLRDLTTLAIQIIGEYPTTDQERLLLAQLLAVESSYISNTEGIEVALRVAEKSLGLLEEFPDALASTIPLIWIGGLLDRPGQQSETGLKLVLKAIAIAEKHNDLWSTAYGYVSLGWHRQNHIEYAEAQRLFHRALSIFKQIGQPLGISLALNGLDENYRTLGDYTTARVVVEEMIRTVEPLNNPIQSAYLRSRLELNMNETFKKDLWHKTLQAAREIGDKASTAWNLYHGAWIFLIDERYDEAEPMLTEALQYFNELGDIEGASWALVFQSQLLLGRKQYKKARDKALEAIASVANIHFPWPVAGAHYVLGDIALAENKWQDALPEYCRALQMAHEIQSIIQMLRHLSGIVTVMIIQEDYEQAILLSTFLYQHPVIARDTRKRVEKQLAHLRMYLNPKDIEQVEREAKQLTLDAAVKMALQWQP
jgi:DNA-binding SARP family transcriptional activator/predicted ATPase